MNPLWWKRRNRLDTNWLENTILLRAIRRIIFWCLRRRRACSATGTKILFRSDRSPHVRELRHRQMGNDVIRRKSGLPQVRQHSWSELQYSSSTNAVMLERNQGLIGSFKGKDLTSV